jgi:hypothetical protein
MLQLLVVQKLVIIHVQGSRLPWSSMVRRMGENLPLELRVGDGETRGKVERRQGWEGEPK